MYPGEHDVFGITLSGYHKSNSALISKELRKSQTRTDLTMYSSAGRALGWYFKGRRFDSNRD